MRTTKLFLTDQCVKSTVKVACIVVGTKRRFLGVVDFHVTKCFSIPFSDKWYVIARGLKVFEIFFVSFPWHILAPARVDAVCCMPCMQQIYISITI